MDLTKFMNFAVIEESLDGLIENSFESFVIDNEEKAKWALKKIFYENKKIENYSLFEEIFSRNKQILDYRIGISERRAEFLRKKLDNYLKRLPMDKQEQFYHIGGGLQDE